MNYGGASYEKSQVFSMLRQLAQRDPICPVTGAGGDPAVPAAQVDAVLLGDIVVRPVRGPALYAAVGEVTYPCHSG